MKAKQVHAQRKYAQGAHIPISNASTSVDRRVGETGSQNTSKVFLNNNDAKNLLDIVSFSNIHRHTQPIVLVKRLENTLDAFKKEPTIPNHKKNNHVENHNVPKFPARREPDKAAPFANTLSSSSKKKTGRPFKFLKKRLLSKKVRRSNRLRGKPSPKLKKTILFKKKIKPKAKIIRTKRIIKFSKSSVPETNDLDAVCLSTDDDEQPLTYFKTKTQQTTVKDKTEEASTSANAKIKNLKMKKKCVESAVIIVPLAQPTTQSTKPVTSTALPDPNNTGLYYGTNGIERWISESTKDITKVKDFKVPELPQKKKKIEKSPTKTRNASKIVSPPKNVCSSKKFVYLKDVMTASQDDINGNCNNCTRCEVIKKVVELSKLVKDTRKTTRSNALDIDPNTDMTVSAYTNIPSPRVHGTTITRPEKTRALKNDEQQAFYMDLLPGSDKIVEVSWCKIPNRKDSLMSARLISKTNLTNSGDVTLANNETLLDKLLQLYKEKTHGEKSTKPTNTEKELCKQNNSDKPLNKLTNIETSVQKEATVVIQTCKQICFENVSKQTNLEKSTSKQIIAEKATSKQVSMEKSANKQSTFEKTTSKQTGADKLTAMEKPKNKITNNTDKPKNIPKADQPVNNHPINMEKRNKQLIVEKTKNKQTTVDKTIGKQTNLEKPAGKPTTPEKSTGKPTIPEKQAGKPTTLEKPAGKSTTLEKPAGKSTTLEKPAGKSTTVEKPAGKPTTHEKPAGKPTPVEKPTKKQTTVEKLTSKQTTAEKPATKQTATEKLTNKATTGEKSMNPQTSIEKPTNKTTNVLKKDKGDNEISLAKFAETNGENKPVKIIKRSSTDKRTHPNDSAMGDSKKKKLENNFPKSLDRAKLVDAPVFYPTEAEFTDPIGYFEKVMPIASQFGICKVVPPADFTPACTLSDTSRFTVTNQYIPRLYTRWGPAFREMCAIRSYLASQKVHFTRAPLLEGLEVNLPKMYHTVQRLGGLKNVFDKKRWNRVAEEMHFYQLTNPSKKLEQIYVKYLLPYDTLTNRERQMKISEVEQMWQKKNKKMLERAINPLLRQQRLLGEANSESDSDTDQDGGSDSDEEADTGHTSDPLAEAEECIVSGRTMNLNNFEKVAQNAFKMYIPPNEEASTKTIENLYWKLVLFGADHVCVNSASVDSGEEGYGFTKNKNSPYGKHPWNLKVISQNNGNLLRPLGPVLGLTVPTLHLGMIFSTSCWHRDPHGLPWIEYMHQGPEKIWYGIPDEQSQNFRKAVEILCPTVCQNKGIWLSSDITMIPPNMLLEHEVSLSRITQRPHEFVIVFPKAYSSSICTGYTISESVYFATQSWLGNMATVFQELRESCEPTTFALEQLLICVARDARSPLCVLQQVRATLSCVITAELAARAALKRYGLQVTVNKGTRGKRRLIRHQDECEICRTTLYLSKVKGVFGKQSALCVQHALRVLVENKTEAEDKKRTKDNIELEIFFTKNEFEEIEQNLQKRLLSINGFEK